MKRLLTAILLVLWFMPAAHARAANAQLALPTVAHQVGDILNSIQSAISGKKRRRGGRRARGSDTPVLARPPIPPVRKPLGAAENVTSVGSTSATETVNTTPPVPALRGTAIDDPSGTPSQQTVSVPVRSPGAARNDPPTEPLRRTAAGPGGEGRIALPVRRTAAKPAAVATGVADGAAAAPEPPTTWEPAEIAAAYDRCDALLGKKTVDVVPVDPMRKGACGMPAPVKLKSLGETTTISFRPAATLNCRTVAAVHNWLENKVQPAAISLLKSPVVRVGYVSGYVCRNRNGAKTGKLSEHAFGNALDIAGFVLADGRRVSVLKDWGELKRDRVAAAKQRSDTPETPRLVVASVDERVAVASVTPASFDARMPLPVFKGPVRRGVRLNRIPDPGGALARPLLQGARGLGGAAPEVEPDRVNEPTAESVFLKRIHADACGMFGTVLGPEANEAHRDHLHIDTAKRRYKAYCR